MHIISSRLPTRPRIKDTLIATNGLSASLLFLKDQLKSCLVGLHIRQLIYQKVLLNTTAIDIFMELFNNQTNYVSLDYLRLICTRLIHDPIYISHFTGGELHKSGRNRIIDEDENLALIDSQGIRDNFSAFYHSAIENSPNSTSTIRRQLARNRLSIKTTERRHMLRDNVMGMQYLKKFHLHRQSSIIEEVGHLSVNHMFMHKLCGLFDSIGRRNNTTACWIEMQESLFSW